MLTFKSWKTHGATSLDGNCVCGVLGLNTEGETGLSLFLGRVVLARGRKDCEDAAGVRSEYGWDPLPSSPVSLPTNLSAFALVPDFSLEFWLFTVVELAIES